ncbi:MAG TPA: hypothetical protein VFA45_11155 [Actinomycetes bacterium]|jgi:amidase|nr:hypothetical protein [Actinomycetes bacterium]
MPDDAAFVDATAQAGLVASGQASPRELVDAAIGRIEKLDGELNAVVTPLFDKARAAGYVADHGVAGPHRRAGLARRPG